MRHQVKQLLKMGRFPSEGESTVAQVKAYQALLEGIQPPLTDDEAVALLHLFGKDTFWGLSWTLLHLIESSPNWPVDTALVNLSNRWIKLLRERASKLSGDL